MHKTLWIHQFDQNRSKKLPALVASQGFNRVLVKALDGSDWMSHFDSAVEAIHGVGDLVTWSQAFARWDTTMDVWVNPMPDNWQPQLTAWGEVLKALPPAARLVFDCEPYRGFWGPGDNTPLLDALGTLRRDHGKRVGVCFDPRRMDWSAKLLTQCDVAIPMWYEPGWGSGLDNLNLSCDWEPDVNTRSTTADWQEIIDDERFAQRLTGFSVWRAPLISSTQTGWVKTAEVQNAKTA